MFTGIVEEMGQVLKVDVPRIQIGAQRVLEGSKEGDSIAVNGTCLTIVTMNAASFTVEVIPETLRRTNLGLLKPGSMVDLERSLALGDRLGGHWVQGHVEGTGTVLSRVPEKEAYNVRIEAPPPLLRYIVPKGFVAVDGVSLTVVDCDHSSFSVSLIPYTLQQTVLGQRQPGDLVNLETDILGRYVAKLLAGERAEDVE